MYTDLPKGWRECSLSEATSKITDGSHNPPKGVDYGIPMLSAKDIQNNRIFFDRPRYIHENDFAIENRRTQIEAGDILLTIVATIGRTAVVPKSANAFTLQRSVATIKTKNNPYFLCYYFQSKFFQTQLINSAKGTAQKGVYLKTLSQLRVILPTQNEQRQIVDKIEELFSELDKGIENLKTAQQQLKVYRQAVLKWAFVNDKFKEYVVKDITEKIQIGPFGTQLHKEDYIENGIPLINPTHIKDGLIVADKSFTILESKRESLPNYILKEGDVIMGRRGEMARCGLVSKKEVGWFCGTGSLYFRPNLKFVDPVFLYYNLRSEPVKKYLEENAGGTTMANLNLKIVNNIPISIPSIDEQKAIVLEIESRLSVCDKMEETITTSLQQAEALTQGILKRAFEGKLVKEKEDSYAV